MNIELTKSHRDSCQCYHCIPHPHKHVLGTKILSLSILENVISIISMAAILEMQEPNAGPTGSPSQFGDGGIHFHIQISPRNKIQ